MFASHLRIYGTSTLEVEPDVKRHTVCFQRNHDEVKTYPLVTPCTYLLSLQTLSLNAAVPAAVYSATKLPTIYEMQGSQQSFWR